ncbi:RNA exonuclease 5-like isoform X1 [Coregonus clupeaformis]|uniref:RNA exonuclease 5-like isoform X1 n=1 Tax=Coregonus clupeaformis TaxID=59861 RepID=UPI001E1C682C|nr:RNA exonuclease 5-like isoform X1 [Coregonus clupeaformis]
MASPVCLKRKREPSPTPESSKRVKEIDRNGVPESEHRSRPPRLTLPFDRLQEPVTLKDLTELLQFAALGKTGGLKQPSWCHLHHQRKVSGLSVVVLEGLSQAHFYRHYLYFKHLRTKYTSRHSYTPSPGNVISGIFSSEVVGNSSPAGALGDQTSAQPEGGLRWHPVIRKFGLESRGLTGYLLTQEEMIKKHFPVHGMPGSEGFVCTDSDDCVTDSSPLYGLDCEMCLTERGNELTRISLVDSRGSCVLDELVKPPNRILNYLTQFSGITRAMLQPITTTLREVQSKLKKVLPRDAVLVGHSLDNDLRALNLIHPHVIDTSLLYRREFGQRFKLKVLAETVLKKQIQTEERRGHDPTEDAQAALELAQYFIHTGPRQVVELYCEELWGGSPAMYQPPVNRSTSTHKHNNRFAEVLKSSGQSALFIGKRAEITLALSNQQWHSSDREVLSSFKRGLESHSFSVVQLSSFSDHLKSMISTDQHYHTMSQRLREMCVVFAGPLPSDYTERDVRRLFSSRGTVRAVRLLNATQRMHAEVEFELLEGAVLAVEMLNGTLLHNGHIIKVQRPVKESTLDLDVFLSCLQDDPLNANVIYAAGLKANAKTARLAAKVNGTGLNAEAAAKVNETWLNANAAAKFNGTGLNANVAALPDKVNRARLHAKANHSGLLEKVNGTLLNAKAKLAEANGPGLHAKAKFAKLAELSAEVNGTLLKAKAMLAEIAAEAKVGARLQAKTAGLCEEDLREAFGRYGAVKGVILPAKHSGKQKRRRHAFLKYDSPDTVDAVLSSPVELWDRKVSTRRALTPPHLCSWVTMMTTTGSDRETPDESSQETGREEQEVACVMRKLDRRVGKLFRSLPDNTLSIVLLPGHNSSHGDGLCFLEVKQGSAALSDHAHNLNTDQFPDT